MTVVCTEEARALPWSHVVVRVPEVREWRSIGETDYL